MSDWYFTFGSGQAHPNGYIRITAPSFMAARHKMFEAYDAKWCFQYSEEQWKEDSNLCASYQEVNHYEAEELDNGI